MLEFTFRTVRCAGCGAAIEDGSKVTWTRQPYQMFYRSCFDAPRTSAEWDEWERGVREMHGMPPKG